ncbi:MAG: PEP-utilizing enzyme [Clostridia bacterium]|jgi:pyruvate,water dikinase|nr:PEP-utilizing enzyme [Clostridia bacterium]
MNRLLNLTDSAAGDISLTGAKGANLHRLAALNGIHVPGGFVITVNAFRELCAGVIASRGKALQAASSLAELIRAGAEIRQAIRNIPIPEEFLRELEAVLASYPPDILFAVRSSAHNPTSEMGLVLSEVADLAREYPPVVRYLEAAGEAFRMDDLRQVEGGGAVADAFENFLRQYGMRATGEIDIAKPRFRENPAELIGAMLTNIRTLPKGHGKSSFEQGRLEMKRLTEELAALAEQKLGSRKAKKLRRYISFFRNYVGTREYPKYFWICRYDVYKKTIMREAERLADQGILQEPGDIFYLYLEELREAIQTGRVKYTDIARRKRDYAHFANLTPPRVIFSDGEAPEMGYQRNIPTGALPGLGVSSGVVEGRARVIRSIEDAIMEKGDILVTSFTDPSWTPVFVSIAGLVTEVGGMMTHGAVITREYGLPAVVGVVGATGRIRDGDRIRVNGDEGYVEIL